MSQTVIRLPILNGRQKDALIVCLIDILTLTSEGRVFNREQKRLALDSASFDGMPLSDQCAIVDAAHTIWEHASRGV